jgi:gas vesicle protein
MKKLINFIFGAIMGGLVGATVALLLAPSSGDDLRSEMRQRIGSFQKELGEAVSQRKVELETRLNEMRKPGATL